MIVIHSVYVVCLPCQAITRHARHDNLKAKLQDQLKELEEKEKERQQSETYVSDFLLSVKAFSSLCLTTK